mgnify:CR=1 FL=1
MSKLKGITRLGTLVIVTLLMAVLFYPMKSIAWETDTDRPTMDYKNFWIDKDTETFVAVKKCEDACKEDSQCKAFTYVKPGVQGIHGRCYLKNGVPSPVKNTNCISGVVRLETAADMCKNYAATAVQQNQSNIDWACGYSGHRWSSNYQAHYNWCMKVPKSSADFETEERKKLLNVCWRQTSTSGDLAAHDWCYDINDDRGEITFYPIIKNVGANDWKSKKKGYYKIGAQVGSTLIKEEKYTLESWPHWLLKKGQTAKLSGITLPFHPENDYRIVNIWMLHHPEDTNKGNNSNSGLTGFYKGASFKTDPKLVVRMCPH